MPSPSTQIRVAQLTASFGTAIGQVNQGGSKYQTENKAPLAAIPNADLSGSLSFLATAIRRIHGGADFSNQDAGMFSIAPIPSSVGGVDIGSTSAEWGDIYVADAKGLKLGSAQESFVADVATGLQIGSTQKILIGIDANTSDIEIGNVAQAKTILIGADASTKVDVNALLIELDAASKVMVTAASTDADAISVVSDGGMDLVAAAGALDVSTSGGNNAVNVLPHGTGTLTLGLDTNTKVDVNALTVELDAGTAIVLDAGGTAVDAVTVSSAGGMRLDAAAQPLEIEASAALIQIGGDNVAQAINVGGAGARTITVGHDASTKVDVNAAEIELDSAGKLVFDAGSNAVDSVVLNSAGGIRIDAAAQALELEASAAIIKIGTDNVNQPIDIGTAGNRTLTLGSAAAGMKFFAGPNDMIMSGSGIGSLHQMSSSAGVGFSADGTHRGGGRYDGGILVANDATEFATFRSIAGVGVTTSIIGAINEVAALVSSTEPTLFALSLTSNINAGADVTLVKVAGDATNMGGAAKNKMQVFVNGQQLAKSGSGNGAVAAGFDYVVQGNGTTNKLKFSFDLLADDEVMVWDFS